MTKPDKKKAECGARCSGAPIAVARIYPISTGFRLSVRSGVLHTPGGYNRRLARDAAYSP